MKSTIQFLSLLLCFELVIGPVRGSLILPGAALATSCSAGQTFNTHANRCLTSDEVLKVSNATAHCGNDRKCYQDNALRALGDTGEHNQNAGLVKDYDAENLFNEDGEYQNGKLSTGAKIGNAAAIGIPLIILSNSLMNRLKLDKSQRAAYRCKPASMMLMYGGAAAVAVGEVYSWWTHKKGLKEIKKEWDETVMPSGEGSEDKKKEDATLAQSQSFEFLAKNEDQVAKTANTKKGFYLAATGLFASGAVAAAFEQYQYKKAQKDIQITGPSKVTMGTTSSDPAMVTEGNRLIESGRQTVQRLTCATGKDEQLERDEFDKKLAELNAKKEGLDPVKDAKKIKQIDDEIKQVTDAMNYGAQKGQVNTNQPNEYVMPDMGGEYGAPIEGLKPSNIWQYHDQDQMMKMKEVAAYNISTAKDAHDLLELMKEYDSIELENYSKTSYLGEEHNDLKQVQVPSMVSQIIAASLMPEAHAAEGGGGKAFGVLATALPVLLGLKQIIGEIKFKGGQPIASSEVDKIKSQVSGWLSRAIGKPMTRFAINGVLGGWMGIMSDQMNKQNKLSEARAAKLREIELSFATNSGIVNCTDDSRNDPSKPKCFCFTPDNKFNPSRANNPVCSQAKLELVNPVTPLPEIAKICVSQGMSIDPACSCRRNNTCLKSTRTFSMKGFNPGTFRMISAGAAPADDLFNGVASAGDISGSASINAARIKKAADSMLAKTDPAAAKAADKYGDGLEKAILASAGGLSMGNNAMGGGLPSSPAAAAAALDKELKASEGEIDITKAGSQAMGGGFETVDEAFPEFNMNESTADIEIAEIMGQEVDFGSNDINKGSDTNLFDVLSNRYQRSGLRRLFEEQVNIKADKPARTDIVE